MAKAKAPDLFLDDPEIEVVDLDDETEQEDAPVEKWWRRTLDGHRRDERSAVSDTWSPWWSRRDSVGQSKAQQNAMLIAEARKVAQTFVDTFARPGVRYAVVFDPECKTAMTEYGQRRVTISPAPLFDPTLTDEQKQTILTALAVHEASHDRYGHDFARAVAAAFPDRIETAMAVSNIAEDVRIETRFADEYPGFADVFVPALAYVAKAGGQTPVIDRTSEPTDVACAALRYPEYVVWTPEIESEREWWLAWSRKWAHADVAAAHVEAVREALDHIGAPLPISLGGRSSEGSGSGSGEPTSGKTGSLESCVRKAIAAAAAANGVVVPEDQMVARAQDAVEVARALTQQYEWGRGEVYRTAAGVTLGKTGSRRTPDPTASAAIRSAFARTRTGRSDTEPGLKRGRIDNRSIYRIAEGEGRVFSRRTAQSATAYRVWLMVDCSGSMKNRMPDAVAVALAFAGACRQMPNVSLSIWGWTSSQRLGATNVTRGRFSATRVYTDGESVSLVGKLAAIKQGGTPDAETIEWALGALRAECKTGETPVLVVASDGEGTLAGAVSGEPEGRVARLIPDARKKGMRVVSVALSGDCWRQETTFGKGNYVPWKGSISATARPLAEMLGRIVSGK